MALDVIHRSSIGKSSFGGVREVVTTTLDDCEPAMRALQPERLFLQRVRWDGTKWRLDDNGYWWFMGYVTVNLPKVQKAAVLQNWNPLEPVLVERVTKPSPLYRIEVLDKSGDWRGLFRAIPRVPVAPIIQQLSSEAPWNKLDLVREPRFFFTQKAWDEYAEAAYLKLRQVLGDDVRMLRGDTEDFVPIDEYQVAVYTA